jgi:cell division protein FtsW (lipid II flippase)
VSYGGTSMIVSLAMIGLLQAVHVRGRLAHRS